MSSQDLSKLSAAKRALLEKRLRGKSVAPEKQQQIPKRTTQGPVPLSFAQQRLWFLDRFEEGNTSSYNVPFAWEMRGTLSVEALKRSLQEIVHRHEALRTTFLLQDGFPRQQVAPSLLLEVPVFDLQDVPEAEREEHAKRLMMEEVNQPFDLEQGPLLRARLLRMREAEHLLLVNMHHIVSDGWSIGVITKELAALYDVFLHEKESPLPELPVQYPDFALWQREWLQGEVLEKQLSYWKKQLGGQLPTLQLPTDRPRPSKQTQRGAVHALTLPAALTEELKRLSQAEGATLFMTLLAAFKVLLFRYTGQEDVIVGSPIANRNRSELEGLIGFFVNTLVLRTDLSGNPTFRELLSRVREISLSAYAHQDVPFEKLVEEIQPERDMSQSPMFRLIFGLVNTPKEELQLSDLTLVPVELDNETAKFDISFILSEEGDVISGWLEYNTDLFNADTMERMASHFQTLLAHIAEDPLQRIEQIPMLQEAERQLLVNDWSTTESVPVPDLCVHQVYEAQAERTPDAVAVVSGGEQLTYQELNRRANRLAHHLQKLGVRQGTLVGLCLERSLDMATAILGILKAGGAYVPLDPAYPKERLAFMLEDTELSVLLTTERLIDQLPPHGARTVCLEREAEQIARESMENPACTGGKDQLFNLIYTSGSTGRPKGVCVPHRGIVRLAKDVRYIEFNEQVVMLQISPVSFDVAVFEMWGTLLNGGRLVLFPPEQPTPEGVRRVVTEHGVNTLFLTTALFHLVVSGDLTELRGLRQFIAGGDVLSVPHARKVFRELEGCRIYNGYGPTENSVFSTCYPVPELDEMTMSVPIGTPVENTQAYVLDRWMQPVPIGVPGELYVGGAGVAKGYWNRPELTAERFVENVFSPVAGERLYKTGDRVRWLPNGQLEYLGRIDLQVKIRGFRIEIGEIETVLGEHPLVRETAVTAREDEFGNKQLVAYVVVEQEQTHVGSEFRQYLKERLPEYMVPSAFVTLESMPLTPNGKVDTKSLPAPEGRLVLRDAYLAPRDRFEMGMVQVWERVLNMRPIGVMDNFFMIGGESLKAVALMDAVAKRFDAKLPLSLLFRAPTVSELCEHLRGAGESAGSDCLVPIQAGDGTHPPLFLVHPGWGSVLCYASLAGALGQEQTVYGLQCVGHDTEEEPLSDIHEMAERYLLEIKRAAPHGPYRLAGWSFGGAVAFEIARRLEASGEAVEFLGLVDTPFFGAAKQPEPVGWDDPQFVLQEFARNLLGIETYRIADGEEQALADILRKAKDLNILPSTAATGLVRQKMKILHAHNRAELGYVSPAPIAADIHLFYVTEKAARNPISLLDPKEWDEQTTGKVTALPVPGDHHNLVEPPHVFTLAEVMQNAFLSRRGVVI